ncbi:MAG: hypothetical protein Tsb0019_26440 [Roseibium sp.]
MADVKTGSCNFTPARLLVQRFLRDERGATTMEYGMIVAILSVVIIAGIGAIGETTRDEVFGAVVTALNTVLAMGGS